MGNTRRHILRGCVDAVAAPRHHEPENRICAPSAPDRQLQSALPGVRDKPPGGLQVGGTLQGGGDGRDERAESAAAELAGESRRRGDLSNHQVEGEASALGTAEDPRGVSAALGRGAEREQLQASAGAVWFDGEAQGAALESNGTIGQWQESNRSE